MGEEDHNTRKPTEGGRGKRMAWWHVVIEAALAKGKVELWHAIADGRMDDTQQAAASSKGKNCTRQSIRGSMLH